MVTIVALENYSVSGRHGANDWERQEQQEFVVSVYVRLQQEPRSTALADTVDYGALQLVADEVVARSEPAHLLETLCERMLAQLQENQNIAAVRIRIEKPEAPLPLPGGSAVVERHWPEQW